MTQQLLTKCLFLIILSTFVSVTYGLKLNRVILSTDTNNMYFDFWPVVAPAWQKLMQVRPTLALIAKADVKIDNSLGDVIRFEPLPDVPDWFYAQVVRLFLPIYYPEEVCIISDIDMLPLNGKYFTRNVSKIKDDCFVVYRDQANPNGLYPMCYVAAKGKIFKEIFQINSVLDIPNIVRDWYSQGIGWITDETMLLRYVSNWQQKTNRLVKLGHVTLPRIDREAWKYDLSLLKKGHYIDAHLLRPYNKFKTEIDKLVRDLGF